MLIRGKIKDYYDGLLTVYGVDTHVILNRSELRRETLVGPVSMSLEFLAWMLDQNFKYRFSVLVICGKVYLVQSHKVELHVTPVAAIPMLGTVGK